MVQFTVIMCLPFNLCVSKRKVKMIEDFYIIKLQITFLFFIMIALQGVAM